MMVSSGRDVPMFESMIFDMDGVIIDSEPFHYEVNRNLFVSLGMTVTETDYRSYIGTSHHYMWSDLKEKHGLSQPVADLVEMQVRGNETYLMDHAFEPIPGIVPLLSTLRHRGIRIGLASSSSMATIRLVLAKLGLDAYFRAVASGEDFRRGKPAPDIFLATAEALGIEPGRCVVIEDSRLGVQAAKAAGMKCIGFANPNSGGQDLRQADLVVGRIAEISWGVLRAVSSSGH